MFIILRRIKKLEKRIEVLEQQENCRNGKHRWVAKGTYPEEPYLICESCVQKPKVKIL